MKYKICFLLVLVILFVWQTQTSYSDYQVTLTQSPPVKEKESQTTELEKLIHFYRLDFTNIQTKKYSDIIMSASKKYDIEPLLILAIAWQESRLCENVVSKMGAVGMMQLLPTTVKEYGVTEEELFNPEINIDVGTHYLSDLKKYFNGNIELAISAYFWGMGNVNKGKFTTRYFSSVSRHYDRFRFYKKQIIKGEDVYGEYYNNEKRNY